MLLWQTRALHHAWSRSRPSGYYRNHGLAELYETLFVGGIVYGIAGIWRHSGVPPCVFILEQLQSWCFLNDSCWVASLRPVPCVRHLATFVLRRIVGLALVPATYFCTGYGISSRFEYLSNLAGGSRCAQPILQIHVVFLWCMRASILKNEWRHVMVRYFTLHFWLLLWSGIKVWALPYMCSQALVTGQQFCL